MTTPVDLTRATDLCHCGHAEEQHDVVATRYCRATLAEALARTCTCPVGPSTSVRSYDRR